MATSLETLVIATDYSRYWWGIYDACRSPCDLFKTVPKNQLIKCLEFNGDSRTHRPDSWPDFRWLACGAYFMALDFLINIPIGMLGFWAAAKVMGNHKGNANKLDWTGFLLFAFGLVGLTLGLDLLGESHRDNMTTYSALSIGIALLVAYYFYAKGNERAILPLSLFNTRTFRLGIAANIFIRLSGSLCHSYCH